MSRADFLARRAAAKRADILAAARARFAAEGLEASVEAIAAEARVSTATLYRLFESKLALFEAVLGDGVARFEASVEAALAERPLERLSLLARAYARLLDDPGNAGVLRAVLAGGRAAPDAAEAFYRRVKLKVGGTIHAAVAACVEAGKLPSPGADCAPAGDLIMGAIEHATLWRRLLSGEPSEIPPETVADRAVAAVRRAYAPFA